ncbi:MAG: 1-phosphofructokinase family hexose kinase [Lachnospiraceae bacterium]|jgi:1-phosphofructokinase|nr:1-phosphofructokinase family hexose kinase [Lachnospiraceae bacterium]
MITTVNLNPCIDKSVMVSGFKYGELNRVISTRIDVSGKAINVGIAIKKLGADVECLGFNYSENGKELEKTLQNYGISYEFVTVNGKLRTNTKILDMETRILTELNESGGKVTDRDIQNLKEVVKHHGAKSTTVVIGGSVPVGVGKNIYRELIEELSSYPAKIILDAEKDLLLEGVKARPYLIKPNLYELQTAFGKDCNTKEEVYEVAKGIIKKGVSLVCVSLGKEGAILCSGEEAYFSPGLELDIRGVQGAGDSMVAGICIAIERGLPMRELLRYGMAASAGSLVLEGTQMCGKEHFETYLQQIKVERMG